MISVNDAVEIKGTITTVGTTDLTITMKEIFLDSKWMAFNPVKTLTIATTEYDSEFSASELDVIKALVTANKENKQYTEDQLIAIKSVLAKLSS